MKVLQVIHGYPMRYNAGSEVYTRSLCHALAERHEVHVFTREEVGVAPDFRLRRESDADDARVTLHLVNNPRLKDRYRATRIDDRFVKVLDDVAPDIIHVQHLNHLSTSLLREAAARETPIVFTLHDFWLMCPRGQFIQMFPEDTDSLLPICDGQEDRKCAERCYARYFGGGLEDSEADIAYWTGWVKRRMDHVREMVELVDVFIAPARHLMDRFRDEFGIPAHKLVYLDYGFRDATNAVTAATERAASPPALVAPAKSAAPTAPASPAAPATSASPAVPATPARASNTSFTFGYIGTHIPAKGIQDMIAAFGGLSGSPKMRIWGRQRGQDTASLKALVAELPGSVAGRVEWLPEYDNANIARDVFAHVDAIVVPSIWVENSPLVIHEAQQARLPVITADVGGMAEYVHHEVNGLLFRHRSTSAMAAQMQRLVDDPELALRLGRRGYIHDADGNVPAMEHHATQIEALYTQALRRRDSAHCKPTPGPWRITFDTNPDTCNLSCIMCEEHSPYSELLKTRKAECRPHRIMPFELIERVVAEAVPRGLREIIPSTMGEPLLYKRFEDIIALCRRHDVKLNLTTNGTFPKHGAAGWAERIVPVTSDVKFSWNGATKATHERIMLGGDWESAVENVRAFIAVRDRHAAGGGNRCRVTFQLTFMEANVDELAAMVALAAELGVDRVKGHQLWAHFAEIAEQSMRRNASAIERWNEAVLEARAVAREKPLPNGKRVQLDNFNLLEDSAGEDLAPGGQCPFLGQEAWVDAEGRFNPCCAPDAQRRSLGEFGNLKQGSLMDIWNGEDYRHLLASYRTRSLCIGCSMRRPVESTRPIGRAGAADGQPAGPVGRSGETSGRRTQPEGSSAGPPGRRARPADESSEPSGLHSQPAERSGGASGRRAEPAE